MNLHRELNPAEEKEFRQWARENYKVSEGTNHSWHPVVLDECAKMYDEHMDKMDLLVDVKINKIGLDELREQKRHLLQIQSDGKISPEQENAIDGILSLIDAIQDYAVDVLGEDKNRVYSFGKEVGNV